MIKYSNAIPATLILSLFSSLVHGQDYNERTGKLLIASNGFQCFSDGFHVDPNDCAIFYRCTEWGESSENSIQSRFIPIKFRCTEGMVFDIERSSCVNIEETSRLECRLLADDEDLYSRISERQAGDPDYGVVQPAPGYNNQYQQPSYNRPGPQEPNEQNPGDSGDGDSNSNEPMPPSKSPPCEADGFFPIPNDCTHFYRCVSNGNGFLKYDFSCGPGTVWDPDNNVCNHPWAVSRTDCKSGTDGGQGGSEYEISEPPESGAHVGESSSTTTAATTTNRPGYPSQSTTPASYNRPTTTKSTTTTTNSNAPSTTTTTESSETSPAPEGPEGPGGSKDNSTSGGSGGNSCTSEGFFPDEKNCTKFYRCVNEGNNKFTKYEFECAEGTVWDVQETTCNYPYAVQNDRCNSNSSETQTAPESGQSPDSAPPNSQTPSHPTSSSTSSSNNRPSTSSPSSSDNKPTSNNQQSSSSQTTSSSSQSSSSASQTTSSSSQSSSSSSQTTSSQQSSSSTSSTSSQSTSSNQQTSGSQQSTSSTSSSSNQNNNTATNAGSTTTSNNGSQTSKSDKCESEGFFPSSENCNKFYRCVSNEVGGFTKYNFNCGPGTVWDPENNVCNHPWAVKDEKCRSGGGGGGGGGAGGQGTTPMGESTTQSPTTSSSQNNTTPTSSASTTESPYSPTGSSSSTTTSPVDNSSEPGTSVTTTETSSKPTETPEHSSSTTTTHPTNVSTTPASNSNTTTTEAGSKNSTKPNNGIKCEKAGYYPNPTNCKKFYRCVDWDGDKGERFSVYHFDCPAGTIFDPSLNVCNHEESVYPPRDCSGSGSQTTDSTTTSKPDNATNTELPSTTENSNTTEAPTTEPTTLQTTTDASTNTKEPSTTGTGETTTQITTQPESTTKKETETTTAVTSITTTQISTVQPTQQPTTQQPTTQQPTTQQPTTQQPTTQQPTTQQPTTTEISTTPSSETCPELGPDQYALVCPTGFRRHPKFCNLFYQCTVSKTMETKIVTLSCVNGTLYDEKKIQCLPPDETKKCEGSIMTDSRNLKKSNDLVTPITVKSEKSICPNEGLFSYKDDCRLFYKCNKDEQGKMTGFLYQCPEGFAFWSVSKRCEKTEKVPCENTKTAPTSWKSTLAPVESKNIGF